MSSPAACLLLTPYQHIVIPWYPPLTLLYDGRLRSSLPPLAPHLSGLQQLADYLVVFAQQRGAVAGEQQLLAQVGPAARGLGTSEAQ